MKTVLIIDVDDDYDLDDCYVHYKLFKDDECMCIDFGCPIIPIPMPEDVEELSDEYLKGWRDCNKEILKGEKQFKQLW